MKALFLDIDGVLQPPYNDARFKHIKEMKEIAKKLDKDCPGYMFEAFLSEKESPLKDDSPFSVESRIYDLAAVLYDWDKSALQQMERILSTVNAKIVISSDWRNFGLDRMRSFLAIHGLDACTVRRKTRRKQRHTFNPIKVKDSTLTTVLQKFGITWINMAR